MSDEMLDLLQYIAQEIIRGILRKQRMRYGISLTKIGKCFSTMIGQSDFEKLKETIHKPNSRQRSSPATSWKTFVQSVPDIRCRRGKYSIKRGSKESTKKIVDNLSIEEYRQNLLSQVICLLLDNFDVNNRGQNNNTVLHLIASLPIESQEAYNFQIDLFKALIEAKPDCSAKNDQDMTALHIIAGNYLLDSHKGFVLSDRRGLSCKENTKGRYAKMKCLQDLIKKPFLDRGPGGNSILHEWIIYCARFNNLSDTEVSIGEWIIDVSEVLPDFVNDLGCTPLHYAFTNKLVKFMLKNGSEIIDRKNVYGDTPLISIIKGTVFQSLPNKVMLDGIEIKEKFAIHESIPLEYLNHLTSTNDNNKLDIIDLNNFDLVANDGDNFRCFLILHSSLRFLSRHSKIIPGSMELISNLFDKWIIELTARERGATREAFLSYLINLFFVVGTARQQLTATILSHIEKLLKDGADPNKTRFEDDLDPVIHYCCKRVINDHPLHLQLVKILCEYGADKTSKDRYRRTPNKVLQSDPSSEEILKVLRDITLKPRVNIDIQSIRYKSKLEGLCCQPNPKRVGDCRRDSEIIGKGAMSCIYLSIDEKCKREMALKRMEKHFFDKEIKSEIEALKKLEQNQNIINLYYLLEEEDFYYLAIELMDGDLTVLVNEKESFLANPDMCRKLSADIVNGLAFLHQHNMLHRDIKPGNVLYRERPELSLKLADFGLTKHLDDCSVNQTSVFTTASTSLCGTRGWMAPELVKRTQNTHTKESDMYALGLLLHFLFSKGFHPFHSSTEKLLNAISTGSFKAYELETNISQGKGSIRKDLTPEQNHLVRCLLSDDPKERPTSGGLIKHHCYFWSNLKKVKFMWTIGDQPEVAKPSSRPNSTFGKNLQITRFAQEILRDNWSLKIYALFQEISARGRGNIDTKSVLGLIRFFRNAYAHYEERSPDRKDELLNDHFFKTFPEFFVTVWMEVYDQGWMIASGNKLMLMRVIEEMD